MKNKDFIKLIEGVSNNILINDLNSCSYVSKIRLNDCINFYKLFENKKDKKYYFNEIKRLLLDFNLKLNIEFEQIEF